MGASWVAGMGLKEGGGRGTMTLMQERKRQETIPPRLCIAAPRYAKLKHTHRASYDPAYIWLFMGRLYWAATTAVGL